MNIGDRVAVSVRLVKEKYDYPSFKSILEFTGLYPHKMRWVKEPIEECECLFLGWVTKMEGTVYAEPPVLNIENTFRAAMVQPVSKDGRYRKSFVTVLE